MKSVVSYLLYLTEENYERRHRIVELSAESFVKCFSKQNCDVIIVNNGEIVPTILKESFEVLNLKKNYFDIAVHYAGAWLAEFLDREYFSYFYDDFTYYDDSFLEKCTEFLKYTRICSMRLPSYKHNDSMFSTDFTHKSVNSDSVRHDFGAGGQKLEQWCYKDDFYMTNWRPNSRPMMWNTEHFLSNYALTTHKHPVMQSFEAHMYAVADRDTSYLSSFLNNGVCSTVPIETSERTLDSNHYRDRFVSTIDLKDELMTYLQSMNQQK